MSDKKSNKELNKQQLKNKPYRKKKVINFKRAMIIGVFVLYAIVLMLQAFSDAREIKGDLTLTEVYNLIDNGDIEKITVSKSTNKLIVYDIDGNIYEAVNPQNDTFIYDLMNKGVEITIQKTDTASSVMTFIIALPMTLLMAMLAVYLTNTIVGGSTKMFTLVKSEHNHTTFDDIKGMGKTKEDVQFIISQMKNWEKLGELGARPCKGALLYGPPGTGKTMLAKAIAKESGVGFISCSGSDFNEVFVGVGAGRVRSLFDLASVNAPCIIFIDEIDCLGKRRKGGDGASNEHNQTLNSLLQKMDGLNDANGIMVIGATNRKDDLDPALTRPGRFDKHYYVGAPDNKKDRDELVAVYLNNKKLDAGVTLDYVSKLMVGLSGAQVEETLNSAVYISLQDGRDGVIKLSDIDEAIMQTITGGVKKDHTSKRDEQIVATHEAGHAIVSLALGIPISKVSTIPYSSGVGGITIRDTDYMQEDKLKMLSDFENDIKVYLAGKCAEEYIYGEHTQGCSNDLEKATSIIYNMITAYGFSKHGFLSEKVFIESGLVHEVSEEIKDECNSLLVKYNADVKALIEKNNDSFLELRERLIKEKTIVNPTLNICED